MLVKGASDLWDNWPLMGTYGGHLNVMYGIENFQNNASMMQDRHPHDNPANILQGCIWVEFDQFPKQSTATHKLYA